MTTVQNSNPGALVHNGAAIAGGSMALAAGGALIVRRANPTPDELVKREVRMQPWPTAANGSSAAALEKAFTTATASLHGEHVGDVHFTIPRGIAALGTNQILAGGLIIAGCIGAITGGMMIQNGRTAEGH